MANITRIKAHDSEKPEAPKDKKSQKKLAKSAKKDEKKVKKSGKKPFILFRPFVAFGRYVRDSWRELRQVRWPNRKTTWKMVLAVFVYTVLFSAFLVLLGILFDFLFNKLLG